MGDGLLFAWGGFNAAADNKKSRKEESHKALIPSILEFDMGASLSL